jgi:RNA polymerase sigma factor (TIGR02999 family)
LDDDPGKITKLIQRAALDTNARDELYDHVYHELRQHAQFALGRGQRGELQTTELVNEVYLRIEKSECLRKLSNRRMFFSVAAKAMKHVLIDHYRKRQRRLEGSSAREPLDFLIEEVERQTDVDFEELSRELDRLEQESPRQHAVIMHRYFAGFSVVETAELLDVSTETVKRDWRLARVKLSARLGFRDRP